MVQLTEFRIVLPISYDEYKVAQTYMVSRMQKESTGSSEGVEVLKNEPFESDYGKGQYTHKIYHLQSRIPGWLLALVPPTALKMEEEAWNAFPKSKTILTCPYFNRFKIIIESMHSSENGKIENIHNLSKEQLALRKVDLIDIAAPKPAAEAWIVDDCGVDFTTFQSARTGRGPLKPGWTETVQPVMTAYKLVTIDAPYWGFGSRLESLMLQVERALFNESHRKCFSWIDDWHGLSVEQVRALEKANDAFARKVLGKEEPSQPADNEPPVVTATADTEPQTTPQNGVHPESMDLSTTPKARGEQNWSPRRRAPVKVDRGEFEDVDRGGGGTPKGRALLGGTVETAGGSPSTPRGKRQWEQRKQDEEQEERKRRCEEDEGKAVEGSRKDEAG